MLKGNYSEPARKQLCLLFWRLALLVWIGLTENRKDTTFLAESDHMSRAGHKGK